MNKKEMVIKSARELFTKYGYKKVSMDEIAKQANVTKKTIYSYFKDKDSIFKYFIEEEINKMKEEYEVKENSNMPFISMVSESLYSMLLFKRNSDLVLAISKEIENGNKDKCQEFLKLYDDEIINYLEEKIKKEINLKNIKECDAHLTAFIIYKVYLNIMFEYDRDVDEEKVTREVTSILKNGLFN